MPPAGQQVDEVDRAADRGAVAQVGMDPRLAPEVDGERVEAGARVAAAAGDDRQLVLARLVVELQRHEAVDEPARQPRGADVVERVRGADDGEPAPRVDRGPSRGTSR